MYFLRRFVVAFAFGLLITGRASAQQQPPNPESLSISTDAGQTAPAHGPSTATDTEYALGPGDELSLDFPSRPELSGKHVVGPDGRITLPIAGPVSIAELTRTEAEQKVLEALSRYYTDLSVTLRIEKYTSNRVKVIGDVLHPGVLYFDNMPTLLDALARAGLRTSATNPSAIPTLCTIYRGTGQVIEVQLRKLLQGNDPSADLKLRRDDIVFVPAEREIFVSVFGEVNHPGTIPLTSASTLQSVLAQAGSFTQDAGSSPTIQVIQPGANRSTRISVKQLLKPSSGREITLNAGDIIYVPKSEFSKAGGVLTRLSPLAAMVSLAAIASP